MGTIIGQIDGGHRGWPFSAPLDEGRALGAVVEEFFIEGDATAYELEPGTEATADGRWSVRPYATAPYRTRLLVVRPADPSRWNGVVLVNWQNVTLGFDAGTPQPFTVAAGCAWVGVTAQRVGIEGFPGVEHVALRGGIPNGTETCITRVTTSRSTSSLRRPGRSLPTGPTGRSTRSVASRSRSSSARAAHSRRCGCAATSMRCTAPTACSTASHCSRTSVSRRYPTREMRRRRATTSASCRPFPPRAGRPGRAGHGGQQRVGGRTRLPGAPT